VSIYQLEYLDALFIKYREFVDVKRNGTGINLNRLSEPKIPQVSLILLGGQIRSFKHGCTAIR
jgi:hypothetical protein